MKPHDGAIWWHAYPLGFVGAEATSAELNGQVHHRLDRLEPWLDYIAQLGCTGLQLGPVFASETHGYDTIDHFRIDPRLGDEADFDRLVAACDRRNLAVLLDGVFNHVGRSSQMWQSAVAHGPDSDSARWFHLYWNRGPHEEPDAEVFEGHHPLVKLNHNEPAVADYVTRAMRHWLARGIAGWRLDAAYAVDPKFWSRVLPALREEFPQAYFVGEVIHGDYVNIVRQSGLDAVTQYELWKATWSALNDKNFFELTASLERHEQFLQHMVPMTFLGNHDVTRIASQLADDRHLPHALAICLTVGGTPSIYYGDEQGLRAVKEDRPGGDDAVRPAFPATPEGLAPEGQSTHTIHRQLIALRREREWLADARTQIITRTNTQLVYRSSARIDAQQSIDVALNVDDAPFGLPGSGWQSLAGDLNTGDTNLGPHAWAIGHLQQ